ncbi:hypothetical protein [Methylobacterium sp. A54F]
MLTALLVLVPCLVHPAAAGELGRPRLCPEDAPEGVRLPPRPGCGRAEAAVPRGRDGFRDLGNGVSVRVGGRAAAEFGVRR